MATPKSGYIPYIDGARGVAVALVVLSHAGLGKWVPGKFGVTLFFFLSGFLITRLLLAEMQENGKIAFGNFYLRRLFRLYPALLVMIGCGSLATVIMQYPLPTAEIWASIFYYNNYYIGWYRIPVEDAGRVLDILWSLSVEEHFYLGFPLLLQFFMKPRQQTSQQQTNQHRTIASSSFKQFAWFLFLLCLSSLAIRWFTYEQFYPAIADSGGRIYFSTHTRLDSIIWGCLAAVLLFKNDNEAFTKNLQKPVLFGLGCLLILLSLLIPNEFFKQTFSYSFQGIGLFLTIPAIGLFRNPWMKNLLSQSWIIYLGKISYSVYLFHWVIAKLGNYYFEEWSWQWQAFFWPCTLLLSLGSYYFIEQPFIGLRKKYGSKA